MEIILDRTAPCGIRPKRSLSAPKMQGCPDGTSNWRAGCTKPRATAGRISLTVGGYQGEGIGATEVRLESLKSFGCANRLVGA